MNYLVFRLYGPLASWGEAAVGPTRPSASYPGRSAILGLLAAALGIRREEEATLAQLRDNVTLAVKQCSAGTLLRDYHTAQVPSHDKKAVWLTRRDELGVAKDKLNTILSAREYRSDGYWVVAIRLSDEAPWTLDEMAEALRHPRFMLYLGRKSCPLAAPLHPRVVSAGGVREALSEEFPGFTGSKMEDDEKRRLGIDAEVSFAWEGDAGDILPQETRYPYDEPLHRGRWQFASRSEHWHQTREES
ncbi:type I-E CRISPR-associated protein Cas5/CasD [Halorhodospira halochloris]|uniref:CRISPR-associated protein n=1 Tax=Halorhodospira halochloris TaxID=1052 RepID=A0A110B599_HALHR|nr:type I-E CRISPR-associated protein Cas5/CasD [Halorhodospira halochloris]MBK1651144.1 type I-E CRISPR-associated protein Cas5/CasD [Halorhodospira halochloris]MCG5531192.1 type I-E CRISPR-associated protein Cas5/CasD [Halorhodospira halochloris]BAU57413.2 CRISPR-associated protein [Halorhodospira halochloris]